MLKCNRSKNNLREYIGENKDYFHYVDQETYFSIGELLQSRKILEQNVKVVNKEDSTKMYDVLEEIRMDSIECGVDGMVEAYRELGKTKEEIVEKVLSKFKEDLDQEKATALVDKYWK